MYYVWLIAFIYNQKEYLWFYILLAHNGSNLSFRQIKNTLPPIHVQLILRKTAVTILLLSKFLTTQKICITTSPAEMPRLEKI